MLLAIDTSTQTLSIALHDGEALLAEQTMRVGRRHSALLAPLIEQMLSQLEISADDLSALAVAVGPGSYTGVRIGVALAKGMAAARNLPLASATTLEIIVEAQGRARADATLIATVAAGRERVIWATYRALRGAWVEQRPPQISAWAELIASCKEATLIRGEVSAAARAELRAAQASGARHRDPVGGGKSAARRLSGGDRLAPPARVGCGGRRLRGRARHAALSQVAGLIRQGVLNMKEVLRELGIEPVNAGVCCGADGWLHDADGAELPSINPANNEAIATVIQGTEAGYDRAVTAAQAAFESWRSAAGAPARRGHSRFGQCPARVQRAACGIGHAGERQDPQRRFGAKCRR